MQRSRSSEIAGEIGMGFSSVRFGNVIRVSPGPQRKVKSCSGHSPPLSQTGQSRGWLTRMNSSVAFWPSAAGALVRAVFTTIPSCAVSVHPACSFGIPSTSTRPVPFGTLTSRPSIVSEASSGPLLTPLDLSGMDRLAQPVPIRGIEGGTGAGGCSCGHLDRRVVRVLVDRGRHALERRLAAVRAPALVDVRPELVAELADVARDRHRSRVTQRTEALAEDAVADVEQQIELRVLRVAGLDLLQQLYLPARPLAARGALPAGLVHVELRHPQAELHHARAIVDHDHPGRAHHRAG